MRFLPARNRLMVPPGMPLFGPLRGRGSRVRAPGHGGVPAGVWRSRYVTVRDELRPGPSDTAPAPVRQHAPGAVGPGHAVDATPGVRRGRAQVEAFHRRAVAEPP